MIKKFLSMFLAVVLISLTTSVSGPAAFAASDTTIDNSDLLPKWVPDSEVTIDDNNTPDWIKDLIMMEVRIKTATEEGTLASAIKVLDHCAETGVNGIWITPVYDPGVTGNGYGNMGPQSIDPAITGTSDYEQGWKELKKFIDEAHKRNIRIILDVISWGTVAESPLRTEHPKWYSGAQEFGGYSFNWKNEEFKEWYINEVVQIALKTGCDGFRWDVEPNYASYPVHTEIRKRLLAKGRKILSIGEWFNDRGGAYDLEQCSVGTFGADYTSIVHEFLDEYNMVDSIKNGQNIGSPTAQAIGLGTAYKYYTNCITNHDHYYPQAEGKPIVLGYQAILSPFIPMWFIGEEFNNSRDANLDAKGIVLYFNDIKWNELENKENKAYFEDIKRLIRIRRSYPELFSYYPDEFKDTNIAKVNVANCEITQAYARYAGNKAMLVIPNNNVQNLNAKMTVYTPFVSTGLDYYSNYTVTDAETGEVIVKGSASKVAKFTVEVPHNDLRVFLVEATGKLQKEENNSNNSNKDNESNKGNASGSNGAVSNIETEPSDIDNNDTESSDIDNNESESSDINNGNTESSDIENVSSQDQQTDNDTDDANKLNVVPIAIGIVVAVVIVAGGIIVFAVVRNKKKK